jgi:hypothetical protein
MSRDCGTHETLSTLRGCGLLTPEHDAAWCSTKAVRTVGVKISDVSCFLSRGLLVIETQHVSILVVLRLKIDVIHGAGEPVHASHLTRGSPDHKALEEHALCRVY